MAEPIVSIDFPSGEIQNVISRLQERIGDLTEPHEEIGEYMLGQIDNNFRTETNPDGVPWLPNSPRTIALKQAQGRIQKILQRTGYMRSTANYSATSDRVAIGLTDRKSIKHQLGQGVPKREILGVNDSDVQVFIEIYEGYLNA